MADTKNAVNDALVQAKVSLDEAVKRLQAGERISALTPGQLDRLKVQDSTNTGCTNTGCGKPQLGQVASQPG